MKRDNGSASRKKRIPPLKPDYPPSIDESRYAHLGSETTLEVWISELLSRNDKFRKDYSELFEAKNRRIAESQFLELYGIIGLRIPPPRRYLPTERIDVILPNAVTGTIMLTDEEHKRRFPWKNLDTPPVIVNVDLSEKPAKVHLPKNVQVGGRPSSVIDELRMNPPGYKGFGRALLTVQLSRPLEALLLEITDKISSLKRVLGIEKPRIRDWKQFLRVYDMRRHGVSYKLIADALHDLSNEPEKKLEKQFNRMEKLIGGEYIKHI